jgi:hypothetical protein
MQLTLDKFIGKTTIKAFNEALDDPKEMQQGGIF